MNLVFLIGCDHKAAQTYPEDSGLDDPKNETQKKFRELLIRSIKIYAPSLIAEESHLDALRSLKRRSVAFEVARQQQLRHIFCDPYGGERDSLEISDGPPGIPHEFDSRRRMQKYFSCEWPIREEFWIRKLGEDIYRRVLFVCGAGHRETLRRRIESRAIQVKIIEKRFGVFNIWNGDFPAYKAAYRDLSRNGFLPVS